MRVKTEYPRHWFIGKTVWPSGLRRQTQVLVERSAWVRTPQLSLCRSAAAPVLLKETGLPIASTPTLRYYAIPCIPCACLIIAWTAMNFTVGSHGIQYHVRK